MSVEHNKAKGVLYSGIIWMLSGLALSIYGILISQNANIPGLEVLISFLGTIDDQYIYLAAFFSILIEGLYFIGSFFPGASLVLLLAIISQTKGMLVSLITIFLIFIGWSISGIINIYLAKIYRKKIIRLEENEDYRVSHRIWTTWFPAFRASYEVAQIVEGGNPFKVFISSLWVRFCATLFVGAVAFIIPLFININDVSNREGYASIAIVAAISFAVGIAKIRMYLSLRKAAS